MVEFIGLDIETTGSRPESQLIQIGLAKFKANAAGLEQSFTAQDLDVFVADVWVSRKDLNLTAEAMAVNGFTFERILSGEDDFDVDARMAAWLKVRVQGRAFPVGWNVGTFDMTYTRPKFPHSMKFFQAYRSVDLNSVVLALAGDKWEALKKAAKRYAAAQLATLWSVETGPTWHDAGYDAAASLLAFNFLQNADKPGGPAGDITKLSAMEAVMMP